MVRFRCGTPGRFTKLSPPEPTPRHAQPCPRCLLHSRLRGHRFPLPGTRKSGGTPARRACATTISGLGEMVVDFTYPPKSYHQSRPFGQRRELKQLASRVFEPRGDAPFAPWALGRCEWLQPLGKGLFVSSAPRADLRSQATRSGRGPAKTPHEPVQATGHSGGVGPRARESKAHAFEWPKPLATTKRPRGTAAAEVSSRVDCGRRCPLRWTPRRACHTRGRPRRAEVLRARNRSDRNGRDGVFRAI